MELRHLHYFAAVANVLSFRGAAAALHVSAPALSRQIKDLEAELGVRLLDRDTQSVRLTNAGAVFLAEIRPLLAQVRRAGEMAREAGEGRRGRLALGTIGRRLSHWLPQCLIVVQARYPHIRVDLMEMDYAEQLAALKSGAIDIGFMPSRVAAALNGDFHRETILSVPIWALLGKTHALAKASRVALADLARERLLFLGKNKSSMAADYAVARLTARGLVPKEVSEVKGFQTLITMVAARQGVSLLAYENLVLASPGVVLRPLQDQGPDLQLEFCAVHRNFGPQTGHPGRHFLAVLRELIAATGPELPAGENTPQNVLPPPGKFGR